MTLLIDNTKFFNSGALLKYTLINKSFNTIHLHINTYFLLNFFFQIYIIRVNVIFKKNICVQHF